MLYEEDIYKWLQKSVSLKTEKGLRNSLKRLMTQMEADKLELDNDVSAVSSYQKSELGFLLNTYKGI